MGELDMSFPAVAPFRMTEFRERAEFVEYMRHSATLRGDRWLYEQSLATPDDEVVVHGTCGVCLTEASFTASTRSGDPVAGGRVPNWREELVCDCKQRLSNRQRALLHYLLTTDVLHPWTRVLGLGDHGALFPVFKSLSPGLTCWSGSIDRLPRDQQSKCVAPYHLVISVEQLDSTWMQREPITALAAQLIEGGRLVFTTPFDVASDGDPKGPGVGPIGWNILQNLRDYGFSDAKACLYWSEEFGYLGPLNFIFEASR